MTLAGGTKLGPYEIVAPLGAGGMGEVYRARDARLARDVAVKVLPQHLSAEPEVRARFEREAKTVSSLNHPNICTLFDVGREGDTDYLVMELVEGETLAARLAKGALPMAEVLRLGGQIADALDRAHRAGVVHRDLKPANVMVTRAGAKLMDFGLARATGLSGPAASGATLAGLTQSPTIASPLTAEGTIVGTFQYMSPEQLEGREADARSDIWALGCVLYEMASGRRAFDGRSQATLIAAIIGAEPAPLAQVAPLTPPALDELVRTCLAKDADERWQSAGDLRRELQRLAGASGASATRAADGAPVAGAARAPSRASGRLGWLAAAAVTLAALAWALGPWAPRGAAPRLVEFTIEPPEGMHVNRPAEPALSPDGGMLAFVVVDSAWTRELAVRALSGAEAHVLPGTRGALLPFWSPDGRSIAYFAQGKLYRVPLEGGSPAALCDAPDPRGGAWSPSDEIVFAPSAQGGIVRVHATGGATTPVTRTDTSRREIGHRYPQFLPDGRHFLYVAITPEDQLTTWAATLDGGKPVRVLRAGTIGCWAAPGWLLFLNSGIEESQRRLLASRFDPRSLRVSADARLVTDVSQATNYGYPNLAADANGDLVLESWPSPRAAVEWKDRAGRTVATVATDLEVGQIAMSPDGRTLAHSGILENRDIYTRDPSSGVSTRLTFNDRLVQQLRWSPDGRHIAYSIATTGGWRLRLRAADGAGGDTVIFAPPGMFVSPQAWTPDGHAVLATAADTAGHMDLWRIPVDGGPPARWLRSQGDVRSAALSPDGRWIAYIAAENGADVLFLQPYPEPGPRYQVATTQPSACYWSRAGDALVVLGARTGVTEIPISLSGGFHQGEAKHLFEPEADAVVRDYSAATDRFLVYRRRFGTPGPVLRILLGWTNLMERK